MIDENNLKCVGCGSCIEKCPKCAISFEHKIGPYCYPIIDKSKCINCGLCSKVCLLENRASSLTKRKTYAYVSDDKSFINSSSGGFCYDLAKAFIEQKGVVYGVFYHPEQKTVFTKRVVDIDSLDGIRGSKYAKSSPHLCFKQIEIDLNNGLNVAFFGLPCEVLGLKHFLVKQYDNLLTVALLCGGAASDEYLKKYWLELEDKYKTRIMSINFRNKKYGTNLLCSSFKNWRNQERIIKNRDNYYITLVGSAFVRPSCHFCTITPELLDSDFVVGDCFNIKRGHGITAVLKSESCKYNTDKMPKLIENPEITVSSRAIINSKMNSKLSISIDDYTNFDNLAKKDLKLAINNYIVSKFTKKKKIYYLMPYFIKRMKK